MGVTTSSSAETENLWRTAFSLGPRIAPIHCKEFWLHSISPFLYLPMVLVPLSFPAPLCSLSLPQGWSQPEQSHSLEWPWQLHSSSLAKGGPLYGFIQPTPVTAAVETRAKCDQPECEVQDPRSLILMLLAQVWWLVLSSASSWSTEIPTEERNYIPGNISRHPKYFAGKL